MDNKHTADSKTVIGGTRTIEGIIPHKSVGRLYLAVKVRVFSTQRPPAPYRYKGRLIYALPGGGEYGAY